MKMDYQSKSELNNKLTINKDLLKERKNIPFDCEELTNILDGGKDNTSRRRELLSDLFKEALFSASQKLGLSQQERYALAVKRGARIFQIIIEKGLISIDDQRTLLGAIHYDVAIGVHGVMFIPVIERLCTDSQKALWLPKAISFQIIGTYAQTELGHGTNLKALETTALYDKSTEEFVVNTPLPTGMKWWPGGLGKSTNHAVVMAKLVIGGTNHGMQAFMVQIRHVDTHEPLPGVEVGAIGNRVGLAGGDNGYLILKNVRIPRENMLMKFAKVTRDGQFIPASSVSASSNYGTMMLVRSHIVGSVCFHSLAQAVTIAIRYSAVRRQSEMKPGAPEPQIIDYQTQQYKLLPNLVMAYALFFAKQYMLDTFNTVYFRETKGSANSAAELHSQSAGLKAYASDVATEGAEICRRACGGHGYMEASGVAGLCADLLASVTYEGENTVMYLQTARYLVKSFSKAVSGETLDRSVRYLTNEPPPPALRARQDCLNLSMLKQAAHRRAYFMIERVSRKLQGLIEGGQQQYVAWNTCSVELVEAAKAHLDSFVTTNFIDSLEMLTCSAALKGVLTKVCQLHTLHRILLSAGEYLQSGAATLGALQLIKEVHLELLAEIRPLAVLLVDSFDWHDETLGSALGRYDGNVYEALYQTAKEYSLNKQQVHPVIHEALKPFQAMAKL